MSAGANPLSSAQLFQYFAQQEEHGMSCPNNLHGALQLYREQTQLFIRLPLNCVQFASIMDGILANGSHQADFMPG